MEAEQPQPSQGEEEEQEAQRGREEKREAEKDQWGSGVRIQFIQICHKCYQLSRYCFNDCYQQTFDPQVTVDILWSFNTQSGFLHVRNQEPS